MVIARILLANLLQSSKSTFSRGSFLSFFAFKEGMLGTPISARGGWPTVSARLLYNFTTPRFGAKLPDTPATGLTWVSNNSFQESVSAWLLWRRFFDTPYTAVLLKALVRITGCYRVFMVRQHGLRAHNHQRVPGGCMLGHNRCRIPSGRLTSHPPGAMCSLRAPRCLSCLFRSFLTPVQ